MSGIQVFRDVSARLFPAIWWRHKGIEADDIEFNSASVTPWTVTAGGNAIYDINDTYPSALHTRFQGANDTLVMSRAYSAAAGTLFNMAVCFHFVPVADNQIIRIAAWDATGLEAVNFHYRRETGNIFSKITTVDGGAWADRVTAQTSYTYADGPAMLVLDRQTDDSWRCAVGWGGYALYEVGSWSKAFDVATLKVEIRHEGGPANYCHYGIEWIRFNYRNIMTL